MHHAYACTHLSAVVGQTSQGTEKHPLTHAIRETQEYSVDVQASSIVDGYPRQCDDGKEDDSDDIRVHRAGVVVCDVPNDRSSRNAYAILNQEKLNRVGSRKAYNVTSKSVDLNTISMISGGTCIDYEINTFSSTCASERKK